MMTEDWEDIYTCPICKQDGCVPAGGKQKSKILIIGEFPGEDEAKSGKPFSGATGGVLRTELAKMGMDLSQMRITNLWPHIPNKNEDCFKYGVEQAIKESVGRKAILLIGSDTVKYFCGMKVSLVNGMEVTSDYLHPKILMACVQPATVFHGCIGELRFALKNFVDKVEGFA